jgi:pseudouridine kinase
MDQDDHPYVLVIGAAGIDSKGKAAYPLTPGSSTPGTVQISVGGVARNIADNLARLGVEAILLSAVGNDPSGRRIRDNAVEVGLNVDYLVTSPQHHTAAYVAILDESGNLVLSVGDMEIMACLTPQVIKQQRDLIKNATMIVFDCSLSEATLTALLKITTRYQVRTCADPTSTLLAERLKPHLPQIYMITPNIKEAEILCSRSINDENGAITAARMLVNAGVKIAIITMAEAGVVYASASDSGHVPAIAAEVVDLTGASDALTAAVVFALLEEIPLDEAVRLGVSAAGLTLACRDTVCANLSLELLYDHLLI